MKKEIGFDRPKFLYCRSSFTSRIKFFMLTI